ncbi:hypothetical protein ACH5RR_003276 [Cinchona calisaya]|uniref:Uncharacterized protein n=1 Tax=Cinchona calisaya TaxID=153742 RepID=A0ABD3AUI4_9GENT
MEKKKDVPMADRTPTAEVAYYDQIPIAIDHSSKHFQTLAPPEPGKSLGMVIPSVEIILLATTIISNDVKDPINEGQLRACDEVESPIQNPTMKDLVESHASLGVASNMQNTQIFNVETKVEVLMFPRVCDPFGERGVTRDDWLQLVAIIFAYAKCIQAERQILQTDLVNITASCSCPWAIDGDFNAIASVSESLSSAV